MLALLSFDIEEWFHGVPDFSAASWAGRQSTIEEEFGLIAAALADAGQAATFFVLEEVARAHPRLVREVAAAGWEVASHGAGHRTVHELGRTEFRESLRRSLGTLEDLTGRKVIGYRAPMWSLGGATEWAVEVLREQGIQYDSSILLARRGDPRAPFVLRAGGAEILEIPPRRCGWARSSSPCRAASPSACSRSRCTAPCCMRSTARRATRTSTFIRGSFPRASASWAN